MNVLAWLMLSLLEKTAAHLARLAEKLPDDDSTDMARRQRVRRFLSNPRISPRLFVQVFVTLLRPLVQARLESCVDSCDRSVASGFVDPRERDSCGRRRGAIATQAFR